MRRRLVSLMALVVSLAAWGEAPPPPAASAPAPARRSLAVLPFIAPEPFGFKTGQLLADVMAQEAQRTGAFDVTAPSDLATFLGAERQKQLLGCGDSSCSLEIANALDVAFVLSGSVEAVAGRARLSMSLLDSKHTKAIDRLSVEVDQAPEALISGTKALTRQLLEKLGVKAATGELTVVVAEDPVVVKRRWSLGVGAVGVATLGAAVVLDVLAAQAFAGEKSAAASGDVQAYDAFRARTAALVWPARIAYLAGGVITAAGLAGILLFRPAAPVTVSAAFDGQGGGGLVVMGAWP